MDFKTFFTFFTVIFNISKKTAPAFAKTVYLQYIDQMYYIIWKAAG